MLKKLIVYYVLFASSWAYGQEFPSYKSKCPTYTLISEMSEADVNDWIKRNFNMDAVLKFMVSRKYDIQTNFNFNEKQLLIEPSVKNKNYYWKARNLICKLNEGGSPFDESDWECGVKDPDSWYEDEHKGIVYEGALSPVVDFYFSHFFNYPDRYIKGKVEHNPNEKNYFYCLDGVVFQENSYPYNPGGH